MSYQGAERRQGHNDRATRLGTFLYERTAVLAGALVILYLGVGVTAWGVVETNRRTKVNLERIETLVERAEAEDEFRKQLTEIIQEYNEAHAQVSAEGFATINRSQQCAITKFFAVPLSVEAIAACYEPTPPAPPEPEKPNSQPKEKK
jgi:hypothetical protein